MIVSTSTRKTNPTYVHTIKRNVSASNASGFSPRAHDLLPRARPQESKHRRHPLPASWHASWATPSAPPAPSAPPELPAPSAPSAFPEPSAPPLPSPPPASALPPAPLGASVAPAHGTERGGGRTSAACTTPGRTTRAVIGVSGSASRLSSPPPPPSESPCEPAAPAPAPAPPLVVKGPLVPFTPTPGWPVPSADCGKGCCGEGW